MTMRLPEILAPAGGPDALNAALKAGADAVYFGLETFNARARAHNFTLAGLAETVTQIHQHGTRAYVTVNTLVFDHELDAIRQVIEGCAASGVDAIIVQDLGVARLAAEISPSLTVHASTQMTCTDADSVRWAQSMGAKRVVVARELSIAEIAAIRAETDVELEIFVHGALCISYSGQCLTSEAIGGRSANRGACAQACRLPYDLWVDDEPWDTHDRDFLLSPRDLESSSLIPRLIEAGVHSLKIEGRLKAPEYVTATVKLYRAALDRAVSEHESTFHPSANVATLRNHALQVFTRGSGHGFLGGVDHQALVEGQTSGHRGPLIGSVAQLEERGRKQWLVIEDPDHALAAGDGVLLQTRGHEPELGGRVWTVELTPRGLRVWLGPEKTVPRRVVGRMLYKNHDPKISKQIAHHDRSHRPVWGQVHGRLGAPLRLTLRDGQGRSATVTSDQPLQAAHRRPLDRATLETQLGRMGDSPFALAGLDLDLDPDVMLPLSDLNRLRRAAVAALIARRTRVTVHATPTKDPLRRTQAPVLPPGLFVLCRTADQARAALQAGADGLYIDVLELTGTGPLLRSLRTEFSQPLGVCPPRIRKPGEAKIDRFLLGLQPDMVLVRTLGLLHTLPTEIASIGDFSLNVTHRHTAHVLLDRGLQALTPAHDLNERQMVALLQGDLAPRFEAIIHHPMPFFHMEHCLYAAILSAGTDYRSCGRPCESRKIALKDRTGAFHPVEADVGCRNTVFRGAPQSSAKLVAQLQSQGVQRFRIECLRETPDQVRILVSGYQALLRGTLEPRSLERQLAASGQQTVKGSLQVV